MNEILVHNGLNSCVLPRGRYRSAGGGWTESRCPVSSIDLDAAGGVYMRMAQPCWAYLTARLRATNDDNCSGVGAGEPGPHAAATFIENLPSELGRSLSRPGDGVISGEEFLYLRCTI